MPKKLSKLAFNVQCAEITLNQWKEFVEDIRPYRSEGEIIVTFKREYEFTEEELRHFDNLENVDYSYNQAKKKYEAHLYFKEDTNKFY